MNFHEQIVPLVCGENARYRGQLRVVIRPVPQPWHASSTLLHETALAIARLAHDNREMLENAYTNAFWHFSIALMRSAESWFDENARSKTPDQMRAELVSLAVTILGGDARKAGNKPLVHLPDGETLTNAVHSWTRVGKGNDGSRIVPDLKYCVRIPCVPPSPMY